MGVKEAYIKLKRDEEIYEVSVKRGIDVQGILETIRDCIRFFEEKHPELKEEEDERD